MALTKIFYGKDVLEHNAYGNCDPVCLHMQPDPDGSITEGYSGKDVLEYNIRQLCFSRVASKSGTPWLWWDYADALFERCSIKSGAFTQECAEEVCKLGRSVSQGMGEKGITSICGEIMRLLFFVSAPLGSGCSTGVSEERSERRDQGGHTGITQGSGIRDHTGIRDHAGIRDHTGIREVVRDQGSVHTGIREEGSGCSHRSVRRGSTESELKCEPKDGRERFTYFIIGYG